MRYGRKYTLQMHWKIPFVHISNVSLKYIHLKYTRPVADKAKVAKPLSGCGVYVGEGIGKGYVQK